MLARFLRVAKKSSGASASNAMKLSFEMSCFQKALCPLSEEMVNWQLRTCSYAGVLKEK